MDAGRGRRSCGCRIPPSPAPQLGHPTGGSLGGLEVEAARFNNLAERYPAESADHLAGSGIEGPEDAFQLAQLRIVDEVRLV